MADRTKQGVSSALVNLTRRFTHDLLNGDGEENLELLTPGFAYIGPTPGQSAYDHDEYLRIAHVIRDEDIRIVLANQTYVALPAELGQATVLATFRVFMSKGSNAALLRGTLARLCFHWSLEGSSPKLTCLESAFETELAEAGGQGAGESRTFQRVEDFSDDRLLEFRDDRRISHFVAADGILYVEARGHKCQIHCLEDVFDVNEGISSIEKRLGPSFVRLHRSYLVNPWHLQTLSEKGARLDDGEVLPVPARKLEELRATLRDIRKPRSDIDGIGAILWGGRL